MIVLQKRASSLPIEVISSSSSLVNALQAARHPLAVLTQLSNNGLSARPCRHA